MSVIKKKKKNTKKTGMLQVPRSSSETLAWSLYLDLESQFKRRDGLLSQYKGRRLQTA